MAVLIFQRISVVFDQLYSAGTATCWPDSSHSSAIFKKIKKGALFYVIAVA
jgi:hypothetical protein